MQLFGCTNSLVAPKKTVARGRQLGAFGSLQKKINLPLLRKMTKSVNNSVKEKPATALTTPPSLKRNLSEMCNTAEMYRHVNNREGFYFSRSGCSGETPTITIVEEFDTPMKRNKELKMVKKVVSFGYKVINYE